MGRVNKLGLGVSWAGWALSGSLIACGGVVDSTSVSSESYSPHEATTLAGEPAQTVWWKYEVNGGEPVEFTDLTLPLSVDLDDVMVVLDRATGERRIDIRGELSGHYGDTPVAGTYSLQIVQRIEGGDTTRIVAETQTMELTTNAGGDTGYTTTEVTQTPSTPWEWLPDRANLDQIPLNELHTLHQDVEITGKTTSSSSGSERSRIIEESAPITDAWIAESTGGTVAVQGNAYEHVVVLHRTTDAPSAERGTVLTYTMSLEVARGIGIVRSTGWFTIGATPLKMELVDTNLALTFD